MPSSASSCSTVAEERLTGPAGAVPGPADAGAPAGARARHQDLLAVLQAGGEVQVGEVGAARGAAGQPDGLEHPPVAGEAVDAGAPDLAGHVHVELAGRPVADHPGRRRASPAGRCAAAAAPAPAHAARRQGPARPRRPGRPSRSGAARAGAGPCHRR